MNGPRGGAPRDGDDDDDGVFALLWGTKAGAAAVPPPPTTTATTTTTPAVPPPPQTVSPDPPGFGTTGPSARSAGPDSNESAAAKAVIMDAFRRVFAVVDERPVDRWARDFLFDDSPHTAAEILTSPVVLPYSVSTDFLDKWFELDGRHAGMFDDLIDFSGIFVPSFSAGHLIVGVVLFQNAFSKTSICKKTEDLDPSHAFPDKLGSVPKAQGPLGAFTLSTGRYVRDTCTGSLLIVARDKSVAPGSAPRICFSYVRLLSSTKAERIDIVCREPLYKSGRILESVMFCTVGEQTRFCPMCAAPPSAGCSCRLPMYKPAHPRDFARDIVAMHRYRGDYLGSLTAIAALPPDEPGSSSPGPGSRYAFASLITSMRFSDQSFSDARHKEVLELFQNFAVQRSISSSSPICTTMPSSDKPSGDLALSSFPVLPADAALRTESLGVGLFACSTQVDDGNDETCLATTGIDRAARVSQYQPPPCASSEVQANSNLEDRSAIAPDINESAKVPKTPAPDSNLSSCKEPVRGELTDEAKARKARRKMLNRASAARSNARRKEWNESLERRVVDISRKAAELRKKETELRAENILMRRRLREDQSLQDDRPFQGTHPD